MPEKIPKSEVAEDLLRVSDKVDGHLTVSKYEEIGEYTYSAISNKFGTFNKAKSELGIRGGLDESRRTTDNELLAKIQELNNELDGGVSAADFDENTKHSKTTIQRRFGSWSDAKGLAGIDSDDKHPTTYTDKYRRLNQIKESVGCMSCGYDSCTAALEFHHKNPDIKTEPVGRLVSGFAWQEVLEELRKCILVCANCHREIEYADAEVPNRN